MWIIKLSGSLIGAPELAGWLDVVDRNGDGKVIIVPGGGFLADGVRKAQQLANISAPVAHRMAVLCMDQYAILMRGLNPKVVGANTELELAERGWQHRGIVWFPSHMVHHDVDMIKNEHMRSESLAAWLAYKMNATQLVIVDAYKSDEKEVNVQRLVDTLVVDENFPNMLVDNSRPTFQTWLLDKQYFHLFNESFDAGILPAYAVAVTK